MCKRKFSRKWNAFRHNITVHSDLSKIVLKLTNSSHPLNRLKYTKNAHKNKFHKFKYFQSIYKSQDDEDNLDNLLFGEINETDSKIMKIIGQMIKPYLELEASLNYMNPQDKAKVLSTSFITSLSSYNPVKSLSEISDIYRSTQGLKLIAEHFSLANNIPVHQATAFVEDAVKRLFLGPSNE